MSASAAKLLGAALSASGRTVAVAESCTGGLLGGAITSVPGSSRYFSGGVLAYGNSAKISLLSVPPDLIAAHGAVSREVALAMAEGVRSLFQADLAIAVTGVAGPGGGTPEKPVGLVYIGGARLGTRQPYVERHLFEGDRNDVRHATVLAAFAMLEKLANHQEPEG